MINVMYSGNSAIFKGILLSCMSIVKHCKEPLTIYLSTLDYTELKSTYKCITPEQAELLEKVLKQVNQESNVKLMDITQLFKNNISNKNQKNDYTPYAQIRLLANLMELPDKFLYLDSDTMACGNIAELFNIDMTNYEFAVALDYMGKFWIAKDYFNSGVALFNRKLCIDNNLFEKCRNLINTKWFKMPDQTSLYRSKTSILYLDSKFNEQRLPKKDTIIKHFNKGIKWIPFFHIYNVKQWQFDKVHKKLKIYCFDDIFEEYTKLANDYKDIIEN